MQVNESYDLIVIGNQLGGYCLAAAAAQQGKNVLLIEAKARESAVFGRPSGEFMTDLHWEPVIGLGAGSAMDAFLRNIGVYQEIRDLFPEFTPAVQLVSPKGRFDLRYVGGQLETEAAPEFANSVADFRELQPALYGSATPDAVSAELVNYYALHSGNGVRYSVGGKDALKEILTSRLKWYGGKVKRDAWVEEIIFERGKLAGALLSSFEGFVRSKMVVGNTHADGFLKLIPKKHRPDSLVKEVGALVPRYWRLNFTVKVPENVVPEGMGSHVCYHELDSAFSEGQMLQVFVLPQGAYSGIRAGEKVLLVRALLPLEPKTIRPEFIAVTIRRCLRRLEQFIPFIDSADCTVLPDPANLTGDWLYKNYLSFSSIDAIPRDLLVYGRTSDPTCMGGVTSDWSRFGLRGLALCSRDVAPSLGVLGELETSLKLLGQMSSVH